MFLKRLLEYGVLWIVGGTLYFSIELLFRGFSHWTMFVLGGICMMFFAFQGFSDPLWKQVLRSIVFVTACEFITGMIVNKFLGWNVWDYSKMPFHIMGQICLPFTLLFTLLCIGGILLSALSVFGICLSAYILHWCFGEKKPNFHIV